MYSEKQAQAPPTPAPHHRQIFILNKSLILERKKKTELIQL
jgi:hypothetical protein